MLECFCCMRLNTAGVVIGWVGVAASLMMSAFLIFAIFTIDEVTKIVMENISSPTGNANDMRRFLLILIAVHFVINMINLTASVLLVAGTIKERHLMLMPWLFNSGLATLIYSAQVIIIISAVIKDRMQIDAFIILLFIAFFTIIFQIYIWCAVYSLYKKLQANAEQQNTPSQA